MPCSQNRPLVFSPLPPLLHILKTTDFATEVKILLTTVVFGILLPFVGTTLGSAVVFFIKKHRRISLTDCLAGFAAGVMLAASVWSLIIPALEGSGSLGRLSFLPTAAGFSAGIIFMLVSENVVERLYSAETNKSGFVTAFAVTVHNFPEGLAVGLVYASLLSESSPVAAAGALSLSLGIAVQNIPEGAIVSLPLYSDRGGKLRPFLYGVLSGAVEPVAAVTALLFARLFSPLMPLLLSFAAGAMIFVVMQELSEEMRGEKGRGLLFFALGFAVMMSLDVALG